MRYTKRHRLVSRLGKERAERERERDIEGAERRESSSISKVRWAQFQEYEKAIRRIVHNSVESKLDTLVYP